MADGELEPVKEWKKPWWLEYVGAASLTVTIIALLWNGYHTREQLALTRQSVAVLHRPLIGHTAIKPTKKPLVYTIVWQNLGHGPAVRLFVSLVWAHDGYEEPIPELHDWPSNQPRDGRADSTPYAVLGPGGTIEVPVEIPPPGRTHPEYATIQGRIDYSDAAGKYHWTTFCKYFYYESEAFYQCGRYNDADDAPGDADG